MSNGVQMFFAGVSFASGMAAAWYWLASTEANIDPSITKGKDDADVLHMRKWIESVNATGRKVASLNRKAAILTAVSVVFGTVSTLAVAWSSN